MTILIDKQEKTPWSFPPTIAIESAHLVNGDYAIKGDGAFSVERKSLDDFLGTISTGWERFQREMYRMERFGYPTKIIIVEGDFASCLFRCEDGQIIPPEHDHTKLTPELVALRIAELAMIHRAAVYFAGNSDGGAILCEKILEQREKQLSGKVPFLKELGGQK